MYFFNMTLLYTSLGLPNLQRRLLYGEEEEVDEAADFWELHASFG